MQLVLISLTLIFSSYTYVPVVLSIPITLALKKLLLLDGAHKLKVFIKNSKVKNLTIFCSNKQRPQYAIIIRLAIHFQVKPKSVDKFRPILPPPSILIIWYFSLTNLLRKSFGEIELKKCQFSTHALREREREREICLVAATVKWKSLMLLSSCQN